MTTSNHNTTNHLFAYSVEEYDAGNGKKAKTWTRIGVAFPHREGTGLNLQLRALPLDGRIVLLPPDQSDTTPEDRNRNR
jgi:hypothetical protein